MAVYLCETDEEKILDMSTPFFDDILSALNKRLSYEAISGYAGNGFCEDSWSMIQGAHPLVNHGEVKKAQTKDWLSSMVQMSSMKEISVQTETGDNDVGLAFESIGLGWVFDGLKESEENK